MAVSGRWAAVWVERHSARGPLVREISTTIPEPDVLLGAPQLHSGLEGLLPRFLKPPQPQDVVHWKPHRQSGHAHMDSHAYDYLCHLPKFGSRLVSKQTGKPLARHIVEELGGGCGMPSPQRGAPP